MDFIAIPPAMSSYDLTSEDRRTFIVKTSLFFTPLQAPSNYRFAPKEGTPLGPYNLDSVILVGLTRHIVKTNKLKPYLFFKQTRG